jgi:dolichol-phosphate mannosyltransferase
MELPSDVTVVIAAKDEEATIGQVVSSCRPYAHEIIVVVDRPGRDRTAERAIQSGARVLLDHGRGKGDAIRCAIPHIATPLTVFIDADGSHEARDIPRLVQPILDDRADHVSASRLKGGSSELHGGFDEFLRLTGSSLITACINWRFGACLSDSQNGFRAIRTDLLRQLGLTSNSTTIEQEMIMKSLAMGQRVDEVGSHEYRRLCGVSRIRLSRVAVRYVANAIRHLVFTRRPPALAPSRAEQPLPTAHADRV